MCGLTGRVQQWGGSPQQWLRGNNSYTVAKREAAGKITIASTVLRGNNSYNVPSTELLAGPAADPKVR